MALENSSVRALSVALDSEIGSYAETILQAVKDAGNRATDGDTPADPEMAKRLLAKRLREIAALLG